MKELFKKTITNKSMQLKNIVWFYHLLKPKVGAKVIYHIWERSRLFREYDRPNLTAISEWVEEFNQKQHA